MIFHGGVQLTWIVEFVEYWLPALHTPLQWFSRLLITPKAPLLGIKKARQEVWMQSKTPLTFCRRTTRDQKKKNPISLTRGLCSPNVGSEG